MATLAAVSGFIEADALAVAVAGGLWQHVDVVASTGSTNADLARQSREGAPAGRVLVSGHQSAGRGRLARRWEAPPDTSVACSVLVAPRRPMPEWGWLPLLLGMAVADGVRAATGLGARLKWANDVLVNERKLCGILCESVGDLDHPRAVLGFGLNVALRADQLPVPTATSTRLEGSDAGATTIVGEVVVRVAAGEPVRGRAVGVDAGGGIVVDDGTTVRTFVAGDVEHLRPA